MSKIAVAVLMCDGKYLLQLRGQNPGIADPGLFGFFGGHVEPGESSLEAVKREVFEETGFVLLDPELVGSMIDHDVYFADVTGQWANFRQGEGIGKGLFSREELASVEMSKATRDLLYLHEYAQIRKANTVVMCHGVFDVLHYGHLLHLQAARAHGTFLIVSMVGDAFVRKGPNRPIFKEAHRAAMLAALRVVDKVVITDAVEWWDHVHALRPHVFVKGGDYVGKPPPECAIVESLGGKVVFTPPTTFTSSDVIELMRRI